MEFLTLIFDKYVNINFFVGFVCGWLFFILLNLKHTLNLNQEFALRKEEVENLRKISFEKDHLILNAKIELEKTLNLVKECNENSMKFLLEKHKEELARLENEILILKHKIAADALK